jgi:ABC-type glutathione transport system ATPase component
MSLSQILVTHHIDLILPCAYYLVRMLDGRIDVQGTTKDLQEQGIMDLLRQDASSHATEHTADDELATTSDPDGGNDKKPGDKKGPRKLIEESSNFDR